MKRFFKAILPIFVLTPLFVGGCSSDESLELLKFEHVSQDEMPSKKEERVNKLEDDVTVLDDETFNLKATVKNNNRDSFIDLVIYISDTDKTVVYNEGNGTYQCSSVTEYIDNLWVTNIYLTYSVTQINGYLEVKEVSFLHGSNENKKATINDSSVKVAKYHKHDFINEEVIEAPTDYEPGKGTHTCSDCGGEYEYVIQPNYKKYVDEFTYALTDDKTGYIVESVESDLEEYVIPNEYEGKPIVSIGYNLFAPYKKNGIDTHRQLKKVTLPNTLKRIEDGAFKYCDYLEELILPEGLTYFNADSLFYCIGLKKLVLPNSLETYDSNIIGCDLLELTTFGNGKYIGNDSNPYILLYRMVSTEITSYTFHEKTKFIDVFAFFGCKKIQSIDIPEGIQMIVGQTNMTELVSAVFREGTIQRMNNFSFTGCSKLVYLVLPRSLKMIGQFAFEGCVAFSKVYYLGTASEANQISIDDGKANDPIRNATWYYFTRNGASETSTGKWWYFDTDNVTIIEKVVA